MKVYLDYTREELDRQYEHRNFVPDADDYVAAQRAESERVRSAANGRFALSIEPENAALKARIEAIAAADAAGTPIVPATLAEELATNPFLRAGEASVKANLGMEGAEDGAVFAEVRKRKDSF